MNGEGRRRRGALLSLPLAWLFLMFALSGPLAVSPHAAPVSGTGGTGGTVGIAPATGMEAPTGDTNGSPGVLGLPPKVHLIVTRTGTGSAPLAPVLAVLPAPVDRTDAGIRVAADRAGTPPADSRSAHSRWGRAPPRVSA